jgi:hypothetical protein
MTDCALTAPTTGLGAPARRRARRRLPRGIPLWTRLFGVAIVPLEPHRPDAPHAWVVSAGVGAGHVVAVFDDDGSDRQAPAR